MGQFQIRTKEQIETRMRNKVVARSDLSDMTNTSSANHVITAAAREDDDQYYQMSNLQDLFDLDTAEGDDLDERAKELNPDMIERIGKRKATTTVIFSRQATSGVVSIAEGTVVMVPASGSTEALKFKTSAEGQILDTVQDSSPVAVTALKEGATYNVDPGAIKAFESKPAGVDSVSNPSAVTNGRDKESDDSFRRRIRLFLKSLSRATVPALAYAALQAELVSGERIVYASVVEDIVNRGNVTVYVDDGAGTAEQTTQYTGQTILASAVGGERDVYIAEKPIKAEAGYTIYKDPLGGGSPAALVEGTDYWINPATGQVKLAVALTATDEITGDFYGYDGLIKEAQKHIDGDSVDEVNYPGYRAAGIHVVVNAPTTVQMAVTANITVKAGFSVSDVATKVLAAISNYINSLATNEDVILNELRKRAMSVAGMYDLTFTVPTENRVISESQLARILDSNIALS